MTLERHAMNKTPISLAVLLATSLATAQTAAPRAGLDCMIQPHQIVQVVTITLAFHEIRRDQLIQLRFVARLFPGPTSRGKQS